MVVSFGNRYLNQGVFDERKEVKRICVSVQIELLEERIAPDSINGVPGESNGNPGNEVSNGNKPQPSNNTADSHGH